MRPYLEVDVEQLQPLILLGQRDVDALLQAAPQGLIDVPWEVGSGQDNNVLALLTLRRMAAINLARNQHTGSQMRSGPLR